MWYVFLEMWYVFLDAMRPMWCWITLEMIEGHLTWPGRTSRLHTLVWWFSLLDSLSSWELGHLCILLMHFSRYVRGFVYSIMLLYHYNRVGYFVDDLVLILQYIEVSHGEILYYFNLRNHSQKLYYYIGNSYVDNLSPGDILMWRTSFQGTFLCKEPPLSRGHSYVGEPLSRGHSYVENLSPGDILMSWPLFRGHS